MMMRRVAPLSMFMTSLLLLVVCTPSSAGEALDGLPARPRAPASGDFRGLWYDGNAELSGYRLTTPRYGELHTGEMALIYVTEPMSRRSWLKDDDAPPAERVDVIKLNQSFGFLTGIYPYSVMTSVFAPIDDWGGARFSPVKITLTAQEWCGQVFQALWPGPERVRTQIASYFASEGEGVAEATVPAGTLYEDALLIQLRELDGPFADGGDWSGSLMPSIWRLRRAHTPPRPERATIRRTLHGEGAAAVTHFTLEAGDYRRTFEVEVAAPRRIVRWTTSEGADARLLKTARLPYWTENHGGDEALRKQLGLATPAPSPGPEPPAGTTRIGR